MFVWVGGQPRFLAFVLIFIPPVVESAKQKVCLMRLHNLRVAHTIFFAFFFFLGWGSWHDGECLCRIHFRRIKYAKQCKLSPGQQTTTTTRTTATAMGGK